jgi:competence protein ComEA
MKSGWLIAFSVVLTLLATGSAVLITRQPRGQPITLLPPPTPAPLQVYVVGAVAAPGVYSLPAGSRVKEAVEAAGGALPEANLQAINLAALLEDGAKVSIPSTLIHTDEPPLPPSRASGTMPPSEKSGLININTATQAELESLPGIGSVIAQRIIAYRQANGPFSKIEDLLNVPDIGPKTFENIKNLITVESLP